MCTLAGSRKLVIAKLANTSREIYALKIHAKSANQKYNLKDKNMDSNKNTKAIWERKAQTFPRFLSEDSDTIEIMRFFRENGADFRGKHTIDIGCGNGRFTFQLAKEAKSVLAVDISQKMLENLEADAKTLNLHNITTICSAWEDFSTDLRFDIALASLTPALNNEDGFIKAFELFSEYFCYVGWGRVRRCTFMDEILKEHGVKLELPVGLPNVLSWLEKMGAKNVKHFYMKQDFTHKFNTKDEVAECIEWNIEAHSAVVDKQKVRDFVDKNAKGGKVTYMSEREVGIALIPRF